MTQMLRHVGRLATTDSKCVVVMMQIPGREDHALIVESDSLPDRMHQAVMEAVESSEGQNAETFASVLSRKPLPDGGGVDIMNALHSTNKLRAVSIDQVMMIPAPGRSFPLRDILQSLGKLNADPLNEANIPDEYKKADPNDTMAEKFNQHTYNRDVNESEDVKATAKGILLQAELLQRDARALFEKAYNMAPSLRPAPQEAAAKALEGIKHVDPVTGREYKTASALQAAITRRENIESGKKVDKNKARSKKAE